MTKASDETNLAGQGEFGKRLLKVVEQNKFNYKNKEPLVPNFIKDKDLSKMSDFDKGTSACCKQYCLFLFIFLYIAIFASI